MEKRKGRRPQGQRQRLSPAMTVCLTVLLLAGLLLCNLVRLYSAKRPAPAEDTLSVHFIDVGQGDSIYMHCGGTDILIDAGEREAGETVMQYLQQQGVRSLDYVIATHPHSDHIGGLAKVLEEIPAEHVLVSDIPEKQLPLSASYERFLEAVAQASLTLEIVTPGTRYQLDKGAVLEILGPMGTDYESLNNYSLVARLTYGENSFLFTGDMEEQAEKELLQAQVLSPVDVLKVGHHGSSTSTRKKFLAAVSPRMAVIQCGDNSYNHPHSNTVERLAGYTDKIYRTDLQGTIVMESNGHSIQVYWEREAA